jgi:DNA-binding phage protein
MTEWLAGIRDLTERRPKLEEQWRRLIRDAVAAGVSVAEVAEAAGVSRERVYQIRDNRR